jgi:hypothetical protein
MPQGSNVVQLHENKETSHDSDDDLGGDSDDNDSLRESNSDSGDESNIRTRLADSPTHGTQRGS